MQEIELYREGNGWTDNKKVTLVLMSDGTVMWKRLELSRDFTDQKTIITPQQRKRLQ